MAAWLKANRGFLLFLLCFGFLRTAVADWNPVPSGSMRPTILEGDVVFVDRVAYDLKLPFTRFALASFADPQRGDIVTFVSPQDGARLLKRIVAVPGDAIEMRAGVLYLDGAAATYTDESTQPEPFAYGGTMPSVHAREHVAGTEHAVQFLPGAYARRDFARVTVPAGHYFMLGDNRDNSADSRYIGFVPRSAIIGRTRRLVVSADVKGSWLPRLERIGKPLD